MDIEKPLPVVVTTSRLLSTGVDVQTCKNIVIFRQVGSITEFKQIVGRGTRVRQDKGKLFFTILDYTGSASRNFADPDFDGEPPLISEEQINLSGDPVPDSLVEWREPQRIDPEDDIDLTNIEDDNIGDNINGRIKYRVEEGEADIAYETVQILDAYGKLTLVSLTKYTKEQITTLFPDVNAFKNEWQKPERRTVILSQLADAGISVEHLQEIVHLNDADAFDVLCHVAFNIKPLTRKQRADWVEKNKTDFFAAYSEKAQEILHTMLQKYVEFGNDQLQPVIITVEPFSQWGTPMEIAQEFGGLQQLESTINQLQKLLLNAA